MHFVRSYMSLGPNYITDTNLRASKLLDEEFQFWLDFVEKLKKYNREGKILFRARREDGDWALQDTVFDSEETYKEYYKDVDGDRIIKNFEDKGYTIFKIEKTIKDLNEVIYDSTVSEPYIQLIANGYEHLLTNGDL